MKVISLLQPWATLVVIGAKKIETRSWNTTYRGPLAIHASKKLSNPQRELTFSQPFWDALKHLRELPTGAIIGSVKLVDTFGTENADNQIREVWKDQVGDAHHEPFGDILPGLIAREKKFGDYTDGRFGWMLKDPVMFSRPVLARGSLGFWEYPVCRSCGCTDHDCRQCIEETGHPCHWVAEDLCSACV